MRPIVILFIVTLSVSMAWSPSHLITRREAASTTTTTISGSSSRRDFFQKSIAAPTSVVAVTVMGSGSVVATRVHALDMDSFIEQQLGASSSSSAVMTEDQALCKYGFPSKATGEACLRAGMSTKRSGSLDAFGTVDRGDFIRCKQFYNDTGTAYEKVTVCE
ncbi:hypothetical protein ACA910_019914 [Epithemia clementina (nom. ined.)]